MVRNTSQQIFNNILLYARPIWTYLARNHELLKPNSPNKNNYKKEKRNWDMVNFFRNLDMIRDISVPQSQTFSTDPNQIPKPNKRELKLIRKDNKSVGRNIRNLVLDNIATSENDWMGGIRNVKLMHNGKSESKGLHAVSEHGTLVNTLKEVEMKQIIFMAQETNRDLVNENNRLRVRHFENYLENNTGWERF